MWDNRTSGKTKLEPMKSPAVSEFVKHLSNLMGEKGMTGTVESTLEAGLCIVE